MAEQNEPKQDAPDPVTPAATDELTEAQLDGVVGAIGGTNGVARSGSGSATPPPTAPPRPF